MGDVSKLLIQEPPLQVLPSLAVAIGVNEAIVLQQLYYLLRDPRNGRKIAEHKWIFNTYEQWREQYFPFWDVRTIRRVFTRLSTLELVAWCQPEGRISRRKYYRINEQKLVELSDAAKLSASMRTKRPLPITETSGTEKSKESKETPSIEGDGGFEEFEAEWKPSRLSKEQQLRRIKPRSDYPSQDQFEQFLETNGLDGIIGYRSDVYSELCVNKWHQWRENDNRWVPIRSWEKFVSALEPTINGAHGGRF